VSARHTTNAFRTIKPLRLRIPNVVDIVLVSDAEQIAWLNQHPAVSRPIDPTRSWLHRLLDRRSRTDLSVDGKPLPMFQPRSDERRSERQKALYAAFETLRGLPGDERDLIADYLSGRKQLAEIGVVVQQWCGRLFSDRYRSTHETYEAGRLLAGWASAPPWRTIKDRLDGTLARAKAVLATAAGNDLHCVHGTSIGMENVARTIRKLRKASLHPEKQQILPDDILRECLVAPPLVLRGCDDVVGAPFLDHPLTQRSLIVFLVARAFAASGDIDIAFLSDSWSACPARRVVPEMLRTAWRTAHHHPAEVDHLPSVNNWSRLWHRAVS
jgi:hypothetical protein